MIINIHKYLTIASVPINRKQICSLRRSMSFTMPPSRYGRMNMTRTHALICTPMLLQKTSIITPTIAPMSISMLCGRVTGSISSTSTYTNGWHTPHNCSWLKRKTCSSIIIMYRPICLLQFMCQLFYFVLIGITNDIYIFQSFEVCMQTHAYIVVRGSFF